MATSLVTTGVNPLSRPADVVTIGSLPLVGFNPAEGTLLVEAEFEGIDGNTTQPLFEIDDGSASNRLVLGQASGHLTATVTAAGSSILSANVLGSPVAGSIYKMALGYKNAAFSACANGGTVSTAASGAVPGGLSSFRLGSNHDGSAFANGWVRKVSYYPCKLADGELKNLTV
jgi:hypothetical protein